MSDSAPPQTHEGPHTYSGVKARQGDVVLRHRSERIVFATGLVGLIVLVFLVRILTY